MELDSMEVLNSDALDSIEGGFNWGCFGGGVALGAGIMTADPIMVIVGFASVMESC